MANNSPHPSDDIDWDLTTWEGARREQMRRWAQMPLAEMISALEEMQLLAEKLASTGSRQNRPAK